MSDAPASRKEPPLNIPENTETPIPAERPIGYWLRVVDRKLDDAMRDLFADEGITRRDWRRLNLIAGTVDDARLRRKITAHPERLAPLVARGWVTDEPGAPRLTEEGEVSYAALRERVAELRSRVAGAVAPDDYRTTLATLEAVARELGWQEGERMPRRRHHGDARRGHSHGRAAHDDRDRRHHGHAHHGHGHEGHAHGHEGRAHHGHEHGHHHAHHGNEHHGHRDRTRVHQHPGR